MEHHRKRPAAQDEHEAVGGSHRDNPSLTPTSLNRPISPPPKRSRLLSPQNKPEADTAQEDKPSSPSPAANITTQPHPAATTTTTHPPRSFRSPIQLTHIRDLPASSNIDTLTLKDILSDPLISSCWEFNYLHDIDFLMASFDSDVRHLIKVHVVHGFWKREDANRLALQTQASRYPNVSLHAAFLPEMFGTHHSKMMILFRHDGMAQVVIHTANMIARDWGNMTQAVWRSPLLPLLGVPAADQDSVGEVEPRIGSGEKFKIDLLNYLRAYDGQRATCREIVEELRKYDFSAICGALVASVPGRHNIHDDSPTRWGWAAMKQALKAVPIQTATAEIAVQVSSIATLGPTDNWLKNTFFSALSGGMRDLCSGVNKPAFKVVFPTPDEIRKSLGGYVSGGSIHTKIQSAQQVKQLQYLKPMLCHWANDSEDGVELGDAPVKEAGRQRAAPHIKTYIRYADKSIDWTLVTSANLSKQAWGEAASGAGEMRISSYEIGVLLWPSLFAKDAIMRPSFLKDELDTEDEEQDKPAVALRLPYNLPLQRYGPRERPWVASEDYRTPDWKGEVWVRE
ncbi:tyrosyl-DNA phosphodiesterase-domain-containing protein [Cercophora scortea]|uniref:Tyrosyl-DNA phosphodiesterase-domain-containing protein n=1 Tax=Cercophora scortea TaxID=314031 RepID=A0AAE0IGQ4_9PEZI|nr:tyrosyl-DNA phosphodiesterase-domain-containing protein [Cercophora scortea]